MAIKEINIENGFTSDDAIAYVKQVISNRKKTCIYIIHCYGSRGKGANNISKLLQNNLIIFEYS